MLYSPFDVMFPCDAVATHSAFGSHKMNGILCALHEALSDVIEDLRLTTEITIDGRVYRIERYLGGDLKFLNCALISRLTTVNIVVFIACSLVTDDMI